MVKGMTTFVTHKQRGASLLECGVVVVVIGVLASVLLNRLWDYQQQAEQAMVASTVAAIRATLQIRVATAKLPDGTRDLTMLAEENPFDWLKNKPPNYAGAYFSPTERDIGPGNWCFDRTDKSVVYLLNRPKTFFNAREKRLKFKVKLLRLYNNSVQPAASVESVVGLDFEQVQA